MCPTHVRLHFVAKAAMTAMALGMIMTAGVAAPVAAEQAELVKAVSVRQDMTVYRGRLYFQGMDGIDHADEPWVSGGTPSTTRMIKDVEEGQGSSYPGAFIGAGDVVWFTVQNPQQRSLWRTQGTSATTRILDHKDEMVGRPRFANGSTLFFQGTKDDYPTTDLELWKTKGTLQTTTRVRDINPGLGSSEPGPGVRLGKQSYFAANDGKTGRELWRTSGTRASTRRVVDLWSGYLGSNPEHLTVVRDRLYFVADNGYGLGDDSGYPRAPPSRPGGSPGSFSRSRT